MKPKGTGFDFNNRSFHVGWTIIMGFGGFLTAMLFIFLFFMIIGVGQFPEKTHVIDSLSIDPKTKKLNIKQTTLNINPTSPRKPRKYFALPGLL